MDLHADPSAVWVMPQELLGHLSQPEGPDQHDDGVVIKGSMEFGCMLDSKRDKLTYLMHVDDERVRAAQPQVQDLPLRVLHCWRGASDELPQRGWLSVVA